MDAVESRPEFGTGLSAVPLDVRKHSPDGPKPGAVFGLLGAHLGHVAADGSQKFHDQVAGLVAHRVQDEAAAIHSVRLNRCQDSGPQAR